MNSSSLFASPVPPEAGQERFHLKGLDGLRAIAVASVVIYHLWPGALPGGLIGVDLFFVISGYLITALLLREAAYTGKMHLPQFWMRRLRRLIPAMVSCVLICTSVAFLIGGDVLVHMPRQVISALTYTSNWASVVAGNDYFSRTSLELYTNFWSLALEEQFYLAWPVVLVTTCILVMSWKKRTLVPALLCVASISAMVLWNHFEPDMTRGYYGLDTHAFGLMTGAVLALMIPWSMYPPRPGVRVRALEQRYIPALNVFRILAGWASLVLLPVLARILTEDEPTILAPWGLLGASLLGLGVIQTLLPDVRGVGAEWLRRLLSLSLLEWLGKRSYGLYLWHWPVMTLLHYGALTVPDQVKNVAVLILTIIVAALSYRWLEQPVRRKGFLGAANAFFRAFGRPVRARMAAIASMALVVCALTGTVAACLNAPQKTQAQSVIAQGREALKSTESPSPSPSPSGPEAYRPSPGGEDVTMIGDSVTLASADALQSHAPGIDVDAAVSRNMSAGIDLARKRLDQGTLGRIVVISLSTNAEVSSEDIDKLTTISESGEARQLVLVTGQAPEKLDWVGPSNDAVRAAGSGSDKIVVADWAKASDGKPELLVSDGVHPEAAGQDLYASTVSTAIEEAKQKLAQRTGGQNAPGDQPGPESSGP
ncbi:acyltransferase family protein [Rothia uropygialis]|uniref:acyltransferase family protein n=1 Tax=Kocuria sp. 36 TaxID=1415402 RepID=UPI00101C2225|nr:acyltransferase family protein [Kocuria sp. 36]